MPAEEVMPVESQPAAGPASAPTLSAPADADTEAETTRRLSVVRELGLLQRAGDSTLTALTRLARSITGAPSAAVHIFDDALQHRIASTGAPLGTHPAADSMCRLVLEGDERIVTSDATQDPRFSYSSFVRDPVAPVRFYASLPLRSGGGVVVGTLCAYGDTALEPDDQQLSALEDLAQLARTHLELTRIATELGRAATLDPLTGAVNRVIFDDRLAQALARRRRRGTPVVAAVIDFDDFKSINDTHGHGCGDAALQWVARRLQTLVRSEDTVGRLGGDEFGVVAEVADGDCRRLLMKLHAAADGFEPALTLSVGAVLAEDQDDVERLLRRADQAMYAGKLHHRRSPVARD
jgi:diguanylate cyclase (GGDEF)-like protein